MAIIDISNLRLLDDILFAVCCQENIVHKNIQKYKKNILIFY